MSNFLTKFLQNNLKQSMPIIGRRYLTWNGAELEVIYNDQVNEEELEIGGYNPAGDGIVLFVPISSFPDESRPENKQLVEFEGKEWRIDSMVKGDVQWTLNLINKDVRNG